MLPEQRPKVSEDLNVPSTNQASGRWTEYSRQEGTHQTKLGNFENIHCLGPDIIGLGPALSVKALQKILGSRLGSCC